MTSTATPLQSADTTGLSARTLNFSAGPATLPDEVIVQAREDLWDLFGTGIGIMEHSHRGPAFDRVLEEAVADCRSIGDISDEYEILFLQGGATLQAAMIPMSYLGKDQSADYLDTGQWASKAIEEARLFGDVNIAFDGTACDYDHVPSDDELRPGPNPVYTHYTSNNTIYGTQHRQPPRSNAPLITDASSDIFSQPIDINRHAMIYAGAQKNLGPAGVVLVIIRKDFLSQAKDDLPSLLNYRKMAKKGSRLNTPPTFGIYFMGQVFKWILRQGGLAALGERNIEKARLIYDAADSSSGFFQCPALEESRSLMNIVFRTPSPELDAQFISHTAEHGMSGLKGYRSVGGMRASVYNAFPQSGCEALADLMADFARSHG